MKVWDEVGVRSVWFDTVERGCRLTKAITYMPVVESL